MFDFYLYFLVALGCILYVIICNFFKKKIVLKYIMNCPNCKISNWEFNKKTETIKCKKCNLEINLKILKGGETSEQTHPDYRQLS